MSYIQTQHDGTSEAYNTYLVVFKIQGGGIDFWNKEIVNNPDYSLKIHCHYVGQHSKEIQVVVLSEPASFRNECKFQDQLEDGVKISKSDLVMFMTSSMVSGLHKSFYAISLNLSKKVQDSNQNLNNVDVDNNNSIVPEETCENIGTSYVSLDPKFSTQGIQRTQIVTPSSHIPIGQIQVEYLIVTNPIAYGKPAVKPEWLYSMQFDAGHRGAGSGRRLDLPDELLENTIASFNYAHRHGADMCELDVIVSADGIPVVYHDFDVDAVIAQQSRDQLGKFRIQVNEFTLKQMQNFRLLSLHDEEGCPYTLNVPNQAESNKPFPTLEEVLNQVDETCGLNIEIKWPQMLENGKMEARKYREINDFVDRIIDTIVRNARDRRIVVESFDADLVILLRLKQDRFPVVFLSQGMTNRYERYMDLRARSVKNGIYFAQAFDLAGVDLILDYFMMSGKKLVDFMNAHGLIARTWGDLGNDDDIGKLEFLKSIGIQCITYDKIDLIKQQLLHQKQHEQEQQTQLDPTRTHEPLAPEAGQDGNMIHKVKEKNCDSNIKTTTATSTRTQVSHHRFHQYHKSSIVDDSFDDDYKRSIETDEEEDIYGERRQQQQQTLHSAFVAYA